MGFATANVQTLKPYQAERSYSLNAIDPLLDKVETLEVQFDAHGYDFVGVQEGRSKHDGVLRRPSLSPIRCRRH